MPFIGWKCSQGQALHQEHITAKERLEHMTVMDRFFILHIRALASIMTKYECNDNVIN